MSTSSQLDQMSDTLSSLWSGIRRSLRIHGLLPLPDQVYEQVEGRLSNALPPVSMPRGFRESLASNLELLAEHQQSGVVVRQETSRPTVLLVGVGIASLATAAGLVALVIMLTRSGARHTA